MKEKNKKNTRTKQMNIGVVGNNERLILAKDLNRLISDST